MKEKSFRRLPKITLINCMKIKCLKCKTGKARRICPREHHAKICSECCASIRDTDCGDCVHHASAQKYEDQRSTTTVLPTGHFLLEINPEVQDAVNIALGNLEKGLTQKALVSLTSLYQLHPRNHDVNYGIGIAYVVKGQHRKAIEWLQKAIEIYPYSVDSYYSIAVAYQQMHDFPSCIRAYQKVIELGDPQDTTVEQARSFIAKFSASIWKGKKLTINAFLKAGDLFNHAFSLMEKNQWQAALDSLRVSAAISPANAPTQGNIGLCLGYLGRKAEALVALDDALKIDPNYEPAHSNRVVMEKLEAGDSLEKFDFKIVDYPKDKFEQNQRDE
jgi:tetratricopeptide (TPR) repeat protein